MSRTRMHADEIKTRCVAPTNLDMIRQASHAPAEVLADARIEGG